MEALIPPEVAAITPGLYETEGKGPTRATAHLVSTANGWEWFLIELDPDTGEAFGLVRGLFDELGYFSIRELERTNELYGAGTVVLDPDFKPCATGSLLRR